MNDDGNDWVRVEFQNANLVDGIVKNPVIYVGLMILDVNGNLNLGSIEVG